MMSSKGGGNWSLGDTEELEGFEDHGARGGSHSWQ